MSTPRSRAPTPGVIGRDVELGRLHDFVDGLRERGGALVLRGEAGIGKSVLLDRARARAGGRSVRVLAAIGTESEVELAWAGLHQLLTPIIDRSASLPTPQRHALAAAFGLADDPEPEPFRVALAAHRIICEAADAGPLILIVDDAQWLDRSSVEAVAFVARRLGNEPVGVLAAVRTGYRTPLDEAGLGVMELDRLSRPAASELLRREAPDLGRSARDGVLAQAAGNPLALVELARANPVRERLAPSATTLTARLERAFASQLEDLPAEARLVLLAAALDGRASLGEVVASAGRVHGAPVTPTALDAAVVRGLVNLVVGEVRFRHPLIRSAVEQSATPAELLAMYAALAEVVADPARTVWHRAMAAVGPDDAVADELDEHADITRRRGAVIVAAAALERAAALTTDPQTRGERLVRAAELAYELGRVDVVRRLLEQARPLEVGDLEGARLAWLQQVVDGDLWVEPGATRTFVTIAGRMRTCGDRDMALRSLVPIAHRAWWTRTRTRTREYLVEAAVGMGVDADDPRLLAVIALAHPEATGPAVLRRVAHLGVHDVADPESAMHVGIAAEKAGDFGVGARFLGRAVEQLREQGRLGLLTQALVHDAWAATHVGEWERAEAAGTEAAQLARDTRQPHYGLTGQLLAALAAALRGSEPDLEAVLARPERTVRTMKAGPLLAPAHLARGAAALGDGRHEDAFRHLWPVFDRGDPAFHRFMRWPAILDLAEAGSRGDHADQVEHALTELADLERRSGAPILRAGLACARPLTAPEGDAERLYRAALDQDLTSHPFLRARTLFAYGCWLRRHRRSADARPPLRAANDLLEALGATRWAQRARQELRATGERIGPRTPDVRDRLTAQELQIARLAAMGLSNREVGERLFLSHRTIGSHLYRIFPKLGIASRAQLPGALAAADDRDQSLDSSERAPMA